MKTTFSAIILCLLVFSILLIPSTHAESQSFTVAARSYEQIPIVLHQGDEMEFSISVSGGTNDDINMIIFLPDGTKMEGMIYEEYHNDSFVAPQSGSYVFTFDNTISLIVNKSVEFSYEITKNSYYVYIGELPDYAKSYASNAVYEGTEYWKDAFPELNFYVPESQSDADVIIQWVKDFSGVEHIGFQYERLVEVGLGDSYCNGEWKPYSSDFVKQIMTHELGHAIGLAHSDDPNDIMYPTSGKTQYGNIEQEFTITKQHARFVPFCIGQEISAIEYTVSTNDPTYGFDVYAVPSQTSLDSWSQGEPFSYYSDNSCYGVGYLEYFGVCKGVTPTSGLLIIMDKDSTDPLTQISVKTLEKKYTGNIQQISQKSHSYPQEILPLDEYRDSESLEDLFPILPNNEPEETQDPVEPTINDNERSNVSCGEGTVLEEGQCVPAKTIKNSDSKSSISGGCLIATATFGSELAPQVQQLRELRDNTLLQTESGSAFMSGFNNLYYSFSPTVADWERQNPIFKEVVKLGITPLLISLSILNYVDMDSEAEVLGYGISLISLNIGMYIVAPVGIGLILVRRKQF